VKGKGKFSQKLSIISIEIRDLKSKNEKGELTGEWRCEAMAETNTE
jgi:hypothetical protein